ncbi:MAG: hypothetical protein A2808_03905 [Candidatus Moranbacteria bacterium RIFCSPHIGHO2_01_FULL_55_24]|nr:MAG: hypothetical protein A2808_03905 [Candidatus Moranbacteria bacterium RIFCSPHIGHO2_01_FULL_55_24]
MGKILVIAIIAAVAVAGYALVRNSKTVAMDSGSQEVAMEEPTTEAPAGPVKEFTTTAYNDEAGAWFSLKEMRVKKGDTVRLTATNTKGMHDFSLDEFGIKKNLLLNEAVTIEFVADKTGEFIYYCSMPGHRAKGQWGKLIVE